MFLPSVGTTGGPDNTHDRSDQWLLVLEGRGLARVEGKEAALEKGSLVLIEAGEAHEIVNTGGRPLKILSFYAPPAF